MIWDFYGKRLVTHFSITEDTVIESDTNLPGHKVLMCNPFFKIRVIQIERGVDAAIREAKEVMHQYIDYIAPKPLEI